MEKRVDDKFQFSKALYDHDTYLDFATYLKAEKNIDTRYDMIKNVQLK